VPGVGLMVRSYAHAWCSWMSYVNPNKGFFSFWVCFLKIKLCWWKNWTSNCPRCSLLCRSLRNVLRPQLLRVLCLRYGWHMAIGGYLMCNGCVLWILI
jgi:hypothetical protein